MCQRSVHISLNRLLNILTLLQELTEKGLQAKDWANAIAEVVGGKAGGKAESAQGSGTAVSEVARAYDTADEFARLKLK